jgi:tetratricopeptide (TPR) repeat protein
LLFEEVISKYKKIYGENNDKVYIIRQNLATLYRDTKQIDVSIEMFEKLIDDISNFKVDLKPNIIANIYNSVSGCYRQIKNFDDAKENLSKALKIIKDNYGDKNLPIATILQNIGMNYKDQGKFNESLDSYKKALEIRKELLPEGHPDTLAINHNIGQLYMDFGDKENADKYFGANIDLMEKKEKESKK